MSSLEDVPSRVCCSQRVCDTPSLSDTHLCVSEREIEKERERERKCVRTRARDRHRDRDRERDRDRHRDRERTDAKTNFCKLVIRCLCACVCVCACGCVCACVREWWRKRNWRNDCVTQSLRHYHYHCNDKPLQWHTLFSMNRRMHTYI